LGHFNAQAHAGPHSKIAELTLPPLAGSCMDTSDVMPLWILGAQEVAAQEMA
jgi:hypothetical protein